MTPTCSTTPTLTPAVFLLLLLSLCLCCPGAEAGGGTRSMRVLLQRGVSFNYGGTAISGSRSGGDGGGFQTRGFSGQTQIGGVEEDEPPLHAPVRRAEPDHPNEDEHYASRALSEGFASFLVSMFNFS